MTVSHKERFSMEKIWMYLCLCACCNVVLWFIPKKKMYICFLVRLLTKPLPLCTPRLQHKHIPSLQQRPGTAMSTLLPHSRARETSLPTSLEVHRVKAHSQKSPPCFCHLLPLEWLWLCFCQECNIPFVQLLLSVRRGQRRPFKNHCRSSRHVYLQI